MDIMQIYQYYPIVSFILDIIIVPFIFIIVLVSLFNGIPTFYGYLMPKTSLVEEQ